MKRLEVLWLDAGLKMGWQQPQDVLRWLEEPNNFLVSTMGYLFAEDDDTLCIVQGKTNEGILNPVVISKVSIVVIMSLEADYGEAEAKETELDNTTWNSEEERAGREGEVAFENSD